MLCSVGFALEASLKLPEEEKVHKLQKLLEANVQEGDLCRFREIVKYRFKQPNLVKIELQIIRAKLLKEAMYLNSFLKTSKLLNQKVTNDELERFLKNCVNAGILNKSLDIVKMIGRSLTEEEFIIILEKHKQMENLGGFEEIYSSQKTAKSILDLI